MEARLKEAIRKYVRERNIQKTLDEMSVTANVAGYDTPNAFSKPGQTGKKNNRLAKVTGGTVVDDLEEGLISNASAPFTKPSDVSGKNAINQHSKTLKKYQNRKSPPYPANENCNKTMVGNDGQNYISKPNKNNICSWKKV